MRTSWDVVCSCRVFLPRTSENPQENWEHLGQSKDRKDLLRHETRGEEIREKTTQYGANQYFQEFLSPFHYRELMDKQEPPERTLPDKQLDGRRHIGKIGDPQRDRMGQRSNLLREKLKIYTNHFVTPPKTL